MLGLVRSSISIKLEQKTIIIGPVLMWIHMGTMYVYAHTICMNYFYSGFDMGSMKFHPPLQKFIYIRIFPRDLRIIIITMNYKDLCDYYNFMSVLLRVFLVLHYLLL